MSRKLTLEELRKELASRGLDTAGNKAALVKRLDAAILEEEKEAALSSKNAGTKKRKAGLELDAAEEVATDRWRKCSFQEEICDGNQEMWCDFRPVAPRWCEMPLPCFSSGE